MMTRKFIQLKDEFNSEYRTGCLLDQLWDFTRANVVPTHYIWNTLWKVEQTFFLDLEISLEKELHVRTKR